MPANLVILCSVERIPALDQGSGSDRMAGFGLNMTVAMNAAERPSSETMLKPWEWIVDSIRCYWRKTDGTTTSPENLPMVSQDGILRPENLAAFRDKLNEKFDDLKRLPKNFEWIPPDSSGGRAPDRYAFKGENEQPWHVLLGHVSTYPFPIPQSFNLSRLFRVREVEGAEVLFAAPVIDRRDGATFPPAQLMPDGLAAGIASDPRVVFWSYTGGLGIRAYLSPCKFSVDTDPFINLSDQWVRNPGAGRNDFEAEWLASLEVQMSDAFQLAQIILKFLSGSGVTNDFLNSGGNLRACVYLAIGSLRDVVGLGLKTSPDGVRLIVRLLEGRLSESQVSDLLRRVEPREPELFPTLDSWKEFLRETLPGDNKLAILERDFTHQSASRSVSELGKLLGTLNDSRSQKVLWSLFSKQWERLMALAGVTDTVKNAVLAAIADPEQQAQIDLRQQLALSNLGAFWEEFIASNGATDDPQGHHLINFCFPLYLRSYAIRRWSLAIPMPGPADGCSPPTRLPDYTPRLNSVTVSTDLKDKLLVEVDGWADGFKFRMLPPSPAGTTETPHAITLQLAKLEQAPEEMDEFKDPMRRIAGMGVMMRERGTARWRILNMANVFTGTTQLDIGVAPALVPFRMHYRSDLRQVCVSYNNQPIAADSPLSRPQMAKLELNAEGEPEIQGLAHYRYSTHQLAQMPALKFGRRYEFAAFSITNAGALPYLVADPISPCRLRLEEATSPLADAIRPAISYQRRVKVGAIRLLSSTGRPLEFPQVPRGVSPRARDIETLTTDAVDPAGVATASKRELPLVLLAPSGWRVPGVADPSSFEFYVKRPATSWECWDRWKATEAGVDPPHRRGIIADFYRKAFANRVNENNPAGQVDLQLDDPAVARLLFFELRRASEIDGRLGTEGRPILPVVVPDPPSGNALASEQCPLIRVLCQFVSDNSHGLSVLEPSAGRPGGVTVKVNKGDVYRLTIYAGVPDETVVDPNRVKKFAESALPPTLPTFTHNGVVYKLTSPAHIVLEAATNDLPDPGQLFEALKTSFSHDAANGWRVIAELAKPNGLRTIQRAEIKRQVWRWQGRATETHPDLKNDYDIDSPAGQALHDKDIRSWEAIEFGDRPESDHVIHEMASKKAEAGPAAASGHRQFRFDEKLARPGAQEGAGLGSHELRGLHYRFNVTAHSRYAAIMPPDVAASAESLVQIPYDDAATRNVPYKWKSQFVPCRRKEPIPAPKVKLILPLTESFGATNNGSPGLLVVLDEPWHEVGGLGEGLEAEVELVADPGTIRPGSKTDGKTGKAASATETRYYFQFGPDPIVSSTAFRFPDQPRDSKEVFFEPQRVTGPVGHFFDRDNTSALFVGTSFILPAPKYNDRDGDFAWYFVKLRLRRVVTLRLPDGAADSNEYKPGPHWKLTKVMSDFCEPIWAQYLPEFSVFEGNRLQMGDLRLDLNLRTRNLVLRNPQGAAVKLKPFNSQNNIFGLYAVLTRRVFDVTGRPDQELFLGLFKPRDPESVEWTTTTEIPDNPEDGARPEYRVRIIEVQTPSNLPPGNACRSLSDDDLWKRLFGRDSQPGCDAKDRIVRISEPVSSVVRARLDCES